MRERRVDQLVGVALLAQDRRAVLRVLVERGVDLVVEVVEQGRAAPELLVLAVEPRVGAHRRLDGERVAQQRLALRVVGQRRPRPFASDFHAGRYDTARLMQSFVIEGGRPLSGTVRAAGNKNGALPILAATVLASEPITLTNVPRIRDVETMVELLADIGADASGPGRTTCASTRQACTRPSSTPSSPVRSAPRSCSRGRYWPDSAVRSSRRRAGT